MSISNTLISTQEANLGSQHEIYLDETSKEQAPELIPSNTTETSKEQAPELISSNTTEISKEQAPELKMPINNTSKTFVQAPELKTPISSACTISHSPIISKVDIAPKTIKLAPDKSHSYFPTILATLAAGLSLGLFAFIESQKKESNADKTHKEDEETADSDIMKDAIKKFKELTTKKDPKDDDDRDDAPPAMLASLGSQTVAMAARSTPQLETRELLEEAPTTEMIITTDHDTHTVTILWNEHAITIDLDDFIAQIVENSEMVETLQTLGSDTLTLFTNGNIQIMQIDDKNEEQAAAARSEGNGEPAAAGAEGTSGTMTLPRATGEADQDENVATVGSASNGEPAAAGEGTSGTMTPSRATGGTEPSTVAKGDKEDEAALAHVEATDSRVVAADETFKVAATNIIDDHDVAGKVAPTGCCGLFF